MKSKLMLWSLGGALAFCFMISCNTNNNTIHGQEQAMNEHKTQFTNHKPGASFKDTLIVTETPIVVFYNPDKAQLDSIQKTNTAAVFQSQTHEYFFQMRNAGIVIKRDWPRLKQIRTAHARYIAFRNTSSSSTVIDLNELPDFSGMILWDGQKKPHAIDMMSVETELSYYFAK